MTYPPLSTTEPTDEQRSTLPSWLLRIFVRAYEPESAIQRKHRQIIELLWTRHGMGERYYLTMRPPGVSFGAFTKKVTDLVCRGAREGWIVVRFPPAPSSDEDEYQLEFVDPERFVIELEALFPERRRSAEPEQ
jgi:hypothetical protein